MRSMESRWLPGVISVSVFAGGQISDSDSSDWLKQPAWSQWRVRLYVCRGLHFCRLKSSWLSKVKKTIQKSHYWKE